MIRKALKPLSHPGDLNCAPPRPRVRSVQCQMATPWPPRVTRTFSEPSRRPLFGYGLGRSLRRMHVTQKSAQVHLFFASSKEIGGSPCCRAPSWSAALLLAVDAARPGAAAASASSPLAARQQPPAMPAQVRARVRVRRTLNLFRKPLLWPCRPCRRAAAMHTVLTRCRRSTAQPLTRAGRPRVYARAASWLPWTSRSRPSAGSAGATRLSTCRCQTLRTSSPHPGPTASCVWRLARAARGRILRRADVLGVGHLRGGHVGLVGRGVHARDVVR